MSIFQVLSNLRHDGELKEAGSVFEGDLKDFASLVKDGVLRVVEGAKTLEEAASTVVKEAEESATVAAQQEAAQPKDTWGPSKPDPEKPEGEVAAPTISVQLPAPGTAGQGDLPPTGDDL